MPDSSNESSSVSDTNSIDNLKIELINLDIFRNSLVGKKEYTPKHTEREEALYQEMTDMLNVLTIDNNETGIKELQNMILDFNESIEIKNKRHMEATSRGSTFLPGLSNFISKIKAKILNKEKGNDVPNSQINKDGKWKKKENLPKI